MNSFSTRPKTRKDDIVQAGLQIALTHGGHAISWTAIGEALGVKHSAVMYHYKTKPKLMRAIMREAVATKCLPVIAWGVVSKDPTISKAPEELRREALAHV